MKKTVAVLPGDGIGTEVMEGTIKVLNAVADRFGHVFEFQKGVIGGVAIDETGEPLPKETLDMCKRSDAVLLGAVGGPKWDDLPGRLRPEKGLLTIRKELELFANLRPVKAYDSLLDASPLKEDRIKGVDMLILRELTGGLYFGTPSERREGGERVVDTLSYTREEIERIVEQGFKAARKRKKKLTSVDKANVLESSRMWREIVNEKAASYPDVEVEHMLVDAASMKIVQNPAHFDVIVTENLFGDILSDEASMITGSLGMLPSASLRKDGFGLYEPVHGSAPDIAGKNLANPLAMILSASMMLNHSFNMKEESDAIDKAVMEVLEAGYFTTDLAGVGKQSLSTDKMVDQVIFQLAEDNATAGIMEAYA
ncbi:3-isopropylmalate dehydrogenase [Alkalihalobacillus sp. CinArs1]|uniref:3-isopropylmalate dehydrogenase n=1 Tax=Alkalihalobacillus sp. CinArs1 TaxID=2995314 RepID=UPI0022DE2B10|nr:3-isopropylmalate dehydrogenase [Alkalihalobacillus sp. CinArs1]